MPPGLRGCRSLSCVVSRSFAVLYGQNQAIGRVRGSGGGRSTLPPASWIFGPRDALVRIWSASIRLANLCPPDMQHHVPMVMIEELSVAERRVWDAFPSGKIVDFQTGDVHADDLTQAKTWGRERHLRAEVIAALLCGAIEGHIGMHSAVFVRGAYIDGAIELQGTELKHSLFLKDCYIEDGIDLAAATTRTLELRDCRLGPMILVEATINGGLDLTGTRLMASDESALQGDRLTVTNNLWCREGFHAENEVSAFDGAKVQRRLSRGRPDPIRAGLAGETTGTGESFACRRSL
jgi:hypothetical protein